MLSEEESSELSKTISEIKNSGIRSEVIERRFKTLRILFSIGFFTFLSVASVITLAHRIFKLEATVEKQTIHITNLEESLTSFRLEEQQQEEELLKFKSDLYDAVPDGDLSDQVSENKINLEVLVGSDVGKNINRGDVRFKEIALTFDLGTGEDLKLIYEYLSQFPIKITLFVSNENPALKNGSFFSNTNLRYLKKLSELGDRVVFGNHTWSHYNIPRSLYETSLRKRILLSYVSDEIPDANFLQQEMRMVEEKFESITGKQLTKYYRLPYGGFDPLVIQTFGKLGYTHHIFWSNNSVGSLDIPDFVYKKFIYKKDPKTGKTRIMPNPNYKTRAEALDFLYRWEEADKDGMNGAIILMHLGSPRQSEKLIYILPDFIREMLSKGYSFVTVPEIINDHQD
ncbi:polysaccharide deacetylase family protein [Leptospira borgpetersenii]|uniref:polysaccharide deacetylase family protein n=1 Tax=Leptospira borgpetersenii TaxID=174 RepID=UPI0018802E82|nr:polysaccharide deacetylase family protein [Leptospira borgpetersenii]MBE8363488.1 polysaccharide deacetylase family protein [Leptospira borgpetersenii serovar Balcanica]MBE8367070.1 polysaccharide deacetylase family protein [Leptospira borgpetersenii serovar Balcanica]MBE8422481.1 polysaccharide deacetylase family protein [Leptospira borgpetersenii serovar Balcanica]MBF3349590.1 polysaccharide deacetylase family protein [Leptospira borgpetersenii serovar Balcanica]